MPSLLAAWPSLRPLPELDPAGDRDLRQDPGNGAEPRERGEEGFPSLCVALARLLLTGVQSGCPHALRSLRQLAHGPHFITNAALYIARLAVDDATAAGL